MIKIPVDFNAMNKEGTRVWINTKVNSEFKDGLKPGLRVILYEEHDTQVEAVIETETNRQGITLYYGVLDWTTQIGQAGTFEQKVTV